MRRIPSVLLEAVFVGVLGLLFALVANALSPRGLRLSRNYFPATDNRLGSASQGSYSTAERAGTNSGSSDPVQATLQRLQAHGLLTIKSNEVLELVRAPEYQQGLAVLIDARDDSHFQAGHIPGAWQFDHYHPENYLPGLLPVCLNAQKVVVYCKGGACEDSEFAAIMLKDAGVLGGNVFVYAGGISEWTANGQSVETGARGSGQLVKLKHE